ncbi:MAG: peptidylprolyl isomerase [Flavobacteriales bacterium]|nr:peptidylprolyl isomerase [Flavobacteriales bacterium]
MRKFVFNVILSLVSVSAIAQGEVIDKVVAVVGENIVLLSDVEEQIDQMTLSDVAITENSRCEVLEDQMYQKLFLTQAKADSVSVTPEQVDQELSRRLRYFISQFGSEEELVKFYGKTIDEIKADFKDEVRDLLLIQTMQQNVVGGVKISPAEVREFYASIPKDSIPYINAEAMIAQIVRKPPISTEEEDRIKDQLRNFRKRVEEGGEDFGTLAYLYSQDPGSAMNNGELGFVDRTELVPEFANTALALQPGEVSDIVKTQFGYHIIQLMERRGDRMNARHILLIPQVSPLDLQKAKVWLDSIKTKIETIDSLTFAQAAIKYSNDEGTRMNGGMMINPTNATNKFDMETLGQMDRNLLFTIEKLEEGEMTGPELFQSDDGKRAYRLVQLVDMTEPHEANIKDDYNRLQQSAKRKKENIQLETWIKNHSDAAYIWVDPQYQSCPFRTKWEIAKR